MGLILLTLPIVALALQFIFTVDQTGRYISVASVIGLSVLFFGGHNFYIGRIMLIGVPVATFAALWGLLEQFEWNRQLQEKKISSSQEDWSVTQFPSREN